MKKIIFLIVLTFLFNGCCHFTSEDCGCEPPPEEFLSDEPKEWLKAFEDGTFQVFQDDNGSLDSLEIEVSQGALCIGGDECCSDSETKLARLKSVNRFSIRFSVEAMEKSFIEINTRESNEDFIQVRMNAQTEELYAIGERATAEILNDFDWNDELITVLSVNCTGSFNCSDYVMQRYIVSKELGLLEFVDRDSNQWKRVN